MKSYQHNIFSLISCGGNVSRRNSKFVIKVAAEVLAAEVIVEIAITGIF